jgi:archaellum biogenesis protein FlaJ (TadC family)
VSYLIQTIKDIVEEHGLGYAVHCYLSSYSIEDERLSELWRKAEYALDEIEEFLSSVDEEQ